MTVVGKARNLLTLKKNSQAVLIPKLNGKHSSLARGLLLVCSHIPFNTLGNKANGARLEGAPGWRRARRGALGATNRSWELCLLGGKIPPNHCNTGTEKKREQSTFPAASRRQNEAWKGALSQLQEADRPP